MSIKNTITITNTINTNKSYGITEIKEYKNNTNLKLKDKNLQLSYLKNSIVN